MRSPISIIIPVYREENGINETISRVRALPEGKVIEIIVVDGHAEGTTLSVLDDAAVVRVSSPKGRGRQMNAGAEKASGAILLFLHADTNLPPGGLGRIVSVMQAPDCVGGAFALRIDSRKIFFRFIEWLANLRARLTRVPYGDQAIFVRRDYFQAIGGYRDIPILEDVDLMRRIRRQCGRIVLISESVLTSPRRWEKKGLFRTTLRNRLIMGLYLLGAKPERLARLYS
ncbi:MAG: TIGR04283 family arsenosugar biosynthesis glycosyltransferase [Syntrophaceae bacterium]|nr:TIGR04283 family arsenosugar biosynthesis glycosyltransferase [Syntrophaceae bacterium]